MDGDDLIRFECLRLACEHSPLIKIPGLTPPDVEGRADPVAIGAAFYRFVKGLNDAR